ncbi:MAG: septum formation protein Maf [Deltaproteobacteria bacterium]|nr:septum formation protein Maf [Deltaproteobacteria bacterium]
MPLETVPHGPFRIRQPLALASASPRRQALLASLGIHFLVVPSWVPEPPRLAEEVPVDYALRLARLKAGDMAARFQDHLVLGADTMVVADDIVLGKPGSPAAALEALRLLRGREHEVITGVWLMRAADQVDEGFHAVSTVRMASFTDDVLAAYVRSGEPMDKAGSYAIQGGGGFLVRSVTGSVSNVVGLPLQETAAALLRLGVVAPAEGGEGA